MDMVERVDAEEAFMAAVWDALKGDHSDLTRQAIILRAHRAAIRAMLEGLEQDLALTELANIEGASDEWLEDEWLNGFRFAVSRLSALKEVVR